MDGTGPPPLAKDKIKEIPVVVITQDQVGEFLCFLRITVWR
jgi:hypothetical protein